MPRVPTDNRLIQTAAMPGVQRQQVSPDAFGAGFGQDLQRTASIVQNQILGPEWDRANRAKVDDAATKLAAKRIDITNRLKQAQGEQAFEVAGQLEKEFQATIDEARGGLVNPVQRDAFDGEAARLHLGLTEAIDNHVLAQGELVAQQKAEARTSTMYQSAVQNRDDEGAAWRDLQDAQATMETYARSRGVPVEARDAQQAALRSKFTADTIEALADDGNHLGAQKWLDGYRAQLKNPADLARAERATKGATVRGESQRIVDGILAKTGADGNPVTLGDAMAEAAKIKDPMLRAAVEERAVSMLNLRERDKEARATNIMADLYATAKSDPRGADALKQSALDELGRLDPGKRQQLEAWLVREANGEKLPWQLSSARRYEIERIASTPEGRQKFLDTDLRPLLTQMNPADWNKLDDLQKEMIKGGNDSAWLTSREDVVNEALAGMKISPHPWTTNKDGETTPNEPAIGFRREVETEANAIAAAAKRQKPTIEDVRKATDSVMLRKVRLNEWGRDPEAVAATVAKDKRGNAYVPLEQIDPGKAQAIRDLITKAGGSVTDDRVQRAFAARQMNDRALFDQIIKER